MLLNISQEKSALSPMIVSATERESLSESLSASHHSNLNEAHFISDIICSSDFILLHLLGVSGHVNSFIASDILLESLV